MRCDCGETYKVINVIKEENVACRELKCKACGKKAYTIERLLTEKEDIEYAKYWVNKRQSIYGYARKKK